MSITTHPARFDRLLIRGLVGVAFSALIVATAGSEVLRPSIAGRESADNPPTGQRISRDRGSDAMPISLCARADPPVTTFNRNS